MLSTCVEHRENFGMEQSWLSSTIDYVYKSVSGDEAENVRTTSDYQRVFADGVWIRDLPSNSCEPLDATCDMPATPNKVLVSFLFLIFRQLQLILDGEMNVLLFLLASAQKNYHTALVQIRNRPH